MANARNERACWEDGQSSVISRRQVGNLLEERDALFGMRLLSEVERRGGHCQVFIPHRTYRVVDGCWYHWAVMREQWPTGSVSLGSCEKLLERDYGATLTQVNGQALERRCPSVPFNTRMTCHWNGG